MTRLDAALAYISGAVDWTSDAQALLGAKAAGLMRGYDACWSHADWETLSVEETVVVPVVNPETGRTSRTWAHAGKHDGVIEGYGKRCLLEHKTCSEDIADPAAPYWRRLTIDAQVSGYVLQQYQSGVRLDGTLYDVIRKPAIRPRTLSRADQKAITEHGAYCGLSVDPEWMDGERETSQLFEVRLTAEAISNHPWYYQRRLIPRLESDLVEYAEELWQIGKEISAARRTDRHYRNSGACMAYNRPCPYLSICSGEDTTDSDRWMPLESVHRELDVTHDLELLTHSRISVWQLCRRRHYYRYELGIVRRDDDESEALQFGRLIHRALEEWWQPEGEDHGAVDRCAATEVARHAAVAG
jgi:hypothetical protein